MAEATDHPDVIMFPPLIFLLAVIIAAVLDVLVPISFFPPPGVGNWVTWLGVILVVAGVAIAIAGNREFHRQGTNVDPHRPALKVVDTGPYRFTRNPMYLGMILVLAGVVLAFSLEWGVPVWIAFALVLHYGVVRREERYMSAKFGAPYEALLRRTRRWL
ncbi:MAG TPA: isoprenylcysteine carboxylmethyltransferase family protein [Alphaproteobacteria bacterium]|nr:isoprenylcysteine carboxylmethyltransferase family protein [Alphaproteobacteria bacterium]